MRYEWMIRIGTLLAAGGFLVAAVLFFRFRIPGVLRVLLRFRHLLPAVCVAAGLLHMGDAAEAGEIRPEEEGGSIFAETDETAGGWSLQEDADSDVWEDVSGGAPDGEATWSDAWNEGGEDIWSDDESEGTGSGTDGVDEERVRLCLDGAREDRDGLLYCRADNCGITGFAGEGARLFLDGIDCGAYTGVSEDPDGGWSYVLPADAVCALLPEDGPHRAALRSSDGTATTQLFVLDRQPPVCGMELVSPDAARQALNAQGERYYLNADCHVRFTFQDENLDPDLVFVRRGSVTEGQYNSELVLISSFPVTISANSTEAMDVLCEDGVYRYAIGGCDKAGNAPVGAGRDLDESGQSRHIVIDRTKPAGKLVITAGGADCFAMRMGGKDPGGKKAVSADSVLVSVDADHRSEHSPVRAEACVVTSPAPRADRLTGRYYEYGEALRFSVRGRRELRITYWKMEDLAGNCAEDEMLSVLMLDPDAPELTAEILARADGRDGSGLPLYRGALPLRISSRDAREGKGGSGLAEVTLVLYTGNGEKRERVLMKSSGKKDSFLFEGVFTLSPDEAEGNGLSAVVAAVDAAGNRAERTLRFSLDCTAPQIRIRFGGGEAANGHFFSAERRAVVELLDRNFDPSSFVLSTGRGDMPLSFTGEAQADGTTLWRAEAVFREDGDYEIRAHAADRAGNRTEELLYEGASPEHFTIDTLPPEAELVCGDGEKADGRYFREPVQFTVRVRDEHAAGTGDIVLARDGVEETIRGETFSIEEEGRYVLRGTVADEAGNVTELQEETFVVDRTPPELIAEGVADGSANREEVRIRLVVRDRFMKKNGLSCTLTRGEETVVLPLAGEKTEEGTAYLLDPIAEDGLYCLSARARDRAGNETARELHFTVNRRGTVYTFEQADMCRGFVREAVTPSFRLYNPDEMQILSFTVNGNEEAYSFDGERLALSRALTEDGTYRIEIRTHDAAGNVSEMEPVLVRIDRTAPVLTLIGEEDGKKLFYKKAEWVLVSDDPEAEFTELALDGREVLADPGTDGTAVRRIAVDAPGRHTLTAEACDEAGNRSVRLERSFTVVSGPLGFAAGHARALLVVLILLPLIAAGGVRLRSSFRSEK